MGINYDDKEKIFFPSDDPNHSGIRCAIGAGSSLITYSKEKIGKIQALLYEIIALVSLYHF